MAASTIGTTGADEASSGDTGSATRDASSGGASSESGSGGSTGMGPPMIVELEGLLEASTYLHLRPCDDPDVRWVVGGNVHDLWACTGAYARIRGHVVECPGGGCSKQVVQVEEVLEARLCEPTDCGGTRCEPLECLDVCEGVFDCERGSKCVPWAPQGMPYVGRRCVEVDADPVGVGQACSEDATEPWVDDCDATSVCMGGVCVELCDHQGNCSGDGPCVRANDFAVQVCVPYCNPFADACAPGTTCSEINGMTGCIPDAEVPLLEEFPCEDGIQCDANSMCLDADGLPDCMHDACCTPLCNTTAPACPDALPCDPLWEPPPEGLETLGVCASF
jgi:hypothetical protein